jgi:signal peptidase II
MLFAGGATLAFDQWTKALVVRHLAEGNLAIITSWLRVRHVANRRGVPILQNPRAQALLWVLLLAGICLIEWQGYFFQTWGARIGLGIAIGGAGGNVSDRLRRGAVLDFIDLGWWPVFNFADVAITIGVGMALWFLR